MSRSYFLCNTSPRCAAECLVSTEINEPIHKEFQARGLIGNEEPRPNAGAVSGPHLSRPPAARAVWGRSIRSGGKEAESVPQMEWR
jgi:hypothetical protein